jgi:hypothetical protein
MSTEELKRKKKRRISDELIHETIVAHCLAAGPEGKVKPEDIAREIYPEEWQSLLKRVRLFAKQQALAGQILILRKGQPANPEDFKGLITLRIAPTYTPPEESDA